MALGTEALGGAAVMGWSWRKKLIGESVNIIAACTLSVVEYGGQMRPGSNVGSWWGGGGCGSAWAQPGPASPTAHFRVHCNFAGSQ